MSQPIDKESQVRAAKAAWAASPALRAEFVSEETFIAFRLAENRGAFRVLGAGGTTTKAKLPQQQG